jgi:hypothetical protein
VRQVSSSRLVFVELSRTRSDMSVLALLLEIIRQEFVRHVIPREYGTLKQ